MMVVDTSALFAILEGENDADLFAKAIAEADTPMISAATLVELGIVVLNRHGSKGLTSVNRLLREAGFRIETVTADHAQRAIEAYAAYGKGQMRKAGLNYGDCFSYALSKATGLPLLFKGRDFAKTDVLSAL